LINRVFPPVQGLTHDEFTEKFVAILVLFCASGTGIFGAMHEGMTGDPSILYIKTVLDLFTAAIFATMLGFSVMTIGAPLIIVQVALATIAVYILHMITPDMMADFSCAGGLIMVATGIAYLQYKTVSGCQYATRPFAGNALFRPLGQTVCLRTGIMFNRWRDATGPATELRRSHTGVASYGFISIRRNHKHARTCHFTG
jgi:hypothetical protein